MTKEEIKTRIYDCNTDDDIKKFVLERINELSNTSVNTIGRNYTDTFNDFISENIHYKTEDRFGFSECPDLVYDDITPYISLIKSVRENIGYNELILFTTIFEEIYNYFHKIKNVGLKHYITYNSKVVAGKISIKDIRENQCAYCYETAGLSHNMFKLLGFDSTLICGRRNGVPYAYNIIYPLGYNNSTSVLYDPSQHIDFINSNHSKVSFGFFKVLSDEEYSKLKSGENVIIDISSSSEKINQIYRRELENYTMVEAKESYGIGAGKTRLQIKNTELTYLEMEKQKIQEELNLQNLTNE